MTVAVRLILIALLLAVVVAGCQEDPAGPQPLGTISIVPQPESVANYAQWELMESILVGVPVGNSHEGQGSQDFNDMPFGSYMVKWGVLDGYLTPSPSELRILQPEGELTFTGVYRRIDEHEDPERLIYIPPGYVRLGQEDVWGATPVHDVWLDGFWIGKYEVTNGEYAAFIATGGYTTEAYWNPVGWDWRVANNITAPNQWNSNDFHGGGIPGNEHFPVNGVSWWEADAYCRWAGGRLPTEAEWEKAAKGPSPNIPTYPWGEEISGQRANYSGSGNPYYNAGWTTPVGFYDGRNYQGLQTIDSPSPYGLYDVAGNVREWTSSRWASYPYDPDDGREDPPAGHGQHSRLLRGGSWGHDAAQLRCADRLSYNPIYTHARLVGNGFRFARSE